MVELLWCDLVVSFGDSFVENVGMIGYEVVFFHLVGSFQVVMPEL